MKYPSIKIGDIIICIREHQDITLGNEYRVLKVDTMHPSVFINPDFGGGCWYPSADFKRKIKRKIKKKTPAENIELKSGEVWFNGGVLKILMKNHLERRYSLIFVNDSDMWRTVTAPSFHYFDGETNLTEEEMVTYLKKNNFRVLRNYSIQ